VLTERRIAFRVETSDGRLIGACPTLDRARRFAIARATEYRGAEIVIRDAVGRELERLSAMEPRAAPPPRT
jgi:hypothetical protein